VLPVVVAHEHIGVLVVIEVAVERGIDASRDVRRRHDRRDERERWKAGKAALKVWRAIPSGFSAEVTAQYGWIA
jgi:hypothetical protein